MEVQTSPPKAANALFSFTRFLSLSGSLLALLGIAAAFVFVFSLPPAHSCFLLFEQAARISQLSDGHGSYLR